MHRLIYISQRDRSEAEGKDIDDILARSVRNNLRLNITGALFHNADTFVQVLEGDRLHVETVFSRIRADLRHRYVTLLCDEEVRTRWFGNWSMAYIALADPTNRPEDDVVSQMAGDDVLSLLSALVVGAANARALDASLAAKLDEVGLGIALHQSSVPGSDLRS